MLLSVVTARYNSPMFVGDEVESERWSPRLFLRECHPDVRLYVRDLPAGVQGCCDHEKRVIWLNSKLGDVQGRCTLAFEIGHLLQGPTPTDPCLAAAHRRAAEDWAAQMLLPLHLLLDGFRCCSQIPAIADSLGVDAPTLRTRLRNLTDEEQDLIMEALHGLRAGV